MSTSKTSTVSLDKQIEALSVIPEFKDKFQWAEEFTALWDLSIPMAVALQAGWISELTDKGVEEIERCFLSLSQTFEKTPEEMIEMLDAGVE
jgi:hypothetical protein